MSIFFLIIISQTQKYHFWNLLKKSIQNQSKNKVKKIFEKKNEKILTKSKKKGSFFSLNNNFFPILVIWQKMFEIKNYSRKY